MQETGVTGEKKRPSTFNSALEGVFSGLRLYSSEKQC